jgi:hypothetical protein
MYEFKQLTGAKFLSYKDWNVNGFVVGEVITFRPNKFNEKYSDVVIKIIDSGIKSDKLSLAKGDVFTINGAASIQKSLDSGVEEGDILKVVYTGTTITKTGPYKGKNQNTFQVFVAPAQDKKQFESDSETSSDDLI